MWRYLSNVEPPRKKAKSGENQSAERFKQYDKQTRQWKFQSAWKKDDQGREREWLVFDDEMEPMFCSACRTFAKADQDKKGPFVVGTNKFKLENIKAHELSKSHIFLKLALTMSIKFWTLKLSWLHSKLVGEWIFLWASRNLNPLAHMASAFFSVWPGLDILSALRYLIWTFCQH